jgi:peptidoglycan/xylan/chitin deacetylase (PgdA/CDA1 family)
MRYSNKRSRNKAKKIKRVRAILLFSITAAFVVCGSVIMALKFTESKQAVQAAEVVEQGNNSSNETKTTDKSVLSGNSNKQSSDNGYTEDVAFVEKYLAEQMKGKMPEGADGKKVVYLTFDDGPSETVTPQILDTLKAENVHATFFLVGKAIDESQTNKNLVKREFEEGNAIGNHTYSHNYNYLYPKNIINVNNIMAEIEKTNQSLKSVLGEDFSTRAIRFPGGHMTWEKKDAKGMVAMDKALADKDYHQVDWNSLSKDAEGPHKNAAQLKQEVINTMGNKQKLVILMHDTYGKEETAKALPEVIKYLKEQGYEFKVLK